MPASPLTPVTILTGYLGSGKTTLLNRLLRDPGFADTAVLVNEFGEIPIDHHLIRTASEHIAVLSNGCLCCSVAGDLVKALREIYFQRAEGTVPPFRRVVIETSGLADPAPILHTLIELPLAAARYALSGIVCTVDAEHGESALDTAPEAVKQAAMADRLVITKTDRVDAAPVAALRERLAALNPAAPVLEAAQGALDASRLFDTGLIPLGATLPDVDKWLALDRVAAAQRHRPSLFAGERSRHDARVSAFSLVREAPLDGAAAEDALDTLASIAGPRLLRMKGILAIANGTAPPRPRAVHAVQHTLYPPVTLASWPDADQRTRLTFITRDLDQNSVLEVLAPVFGAA